MVGKVHVLMVLNIEIMVFWDVTTCTLLGSYRTTWRVIQQDCNPTILLLILLQN